MSISRLPAEEKRLSLSAPARRCHSVDIDPDFLKSLEVKALGVYAIGDCKEPLYIADAVAAGLQAANSI